MQTSAIGYRVVDHLKQHPPFQAMDEGDLLELAARGRVRFHESDEYVYWQGKPHGQHFFVIQQGRVSLWDEASGPPRLCDVRGPGDLLGVDRFLGSATHIHSARAQSDVLLYAFESAAFEPLLAKYPKGARYLAAHFSASAYEEAADQKRRAEQAFACERARARPLVSCLAGAGLGEMAARLGETGVEALAVVDTAGRLLGVVTGAAVLAAIGRGGAAAATKASELMAAPATADADATVAECVLALAASGTDAVAITEGGSPTGVLHALVTPRDLVPSFGEQPVALFRELQRAPSTEALHALNGRFRAFLLDQLAAPSSVDWLTALARRWDETLFARLVGLTGAPAGEGCSWFFFGATGRGEAMNAQSLQVGLVYDDAGPEQAHSLLDWHARLFEAFQECGYVRSENSPGPDSAYRCGSRREWEDRFRGWVHDPVANALYKARPLFDMRPVLGSTAWFPPLLAGVRDEVAQRETFLHVLANDCLANLPPLSFFRDLVVEESGEQNAVFQLEKSALRPLVDVARVFAIAGGRGLGGSTLERLELGRKQAPEEEKVFREATDTTRLLLFHQARTALRHSGSGAELPPASLSRHDRQALKAGFRAILRLLEVASSREWRRR